MNQLSLFEPPSEMSESQINARDLLKNLIDGGKLSISSFDFCPFCEEKGFELLASIDRHGIGCEARLCDTCGLVYTTPHIAPDSMALFYRDIYGPLNFRVKNGKYLFNQVHGENLHSYVKEFMPQVTQVLDIGAGTGDVIKYFSTLYPNVQFTGFEYNEDYIKSFQATEKCRLLYGGVEEALKLGIKFDFIILSHLFEHIVDLNEFLSKIKLVSAPEAIVYIEVPGIFGYLKDTAHYDYSFENFHTIAHVYNFTLSSLGKVLERNGLKILKGEEKVKCLSTFSSKYLGKTSESLHVWSFVKVSLPFLKENYLDDFRPYLHHQLARYDYPLRQIKMQYFLSEFNSLNGEVRRLREVEKEFNNFKKYPVRYILKKIVSRFSSFFSNSF